MDRITFSLGRKTTDTVVNASTTRNYMINKDSDPIIEGRKTV
jgi:hypothetical protein